MMKKTLYTISSLLLSTAIICAEAPAAPAPMTPADLEAKSKKIDEMQKALEKEVDAFNAQLKVQHDMKIEGSPNIAPKEVHNDKGMTPEQEIEVMRNKIKEMLGRLEELEMNTKKIATLTKVDKDIKFSTPAEREAATHKAAMSDQHNIKDSKAIAQYNKAMEFLNKGDTKAAKAAFQEILIIYPDDPYARNALIRMGDANVVESKYADAIEFYDRGLATNLDGDLYNDGVLGKSEALIKKGERTAACKVLISFNKANTPLHEKQNERLQKLLIDADCASKMDKDRKKAVDASEE